MISPVEPSPMEPRTWMTRDEGQDLASRLARPPSARGPSSTPSWNAPRDEDDYQRDERPTSEYYRRSQREPSPEYDYSPPDNSRYPHQPLELRLTTTRDYPVRAEYPSPRAGKGREIDNSYPDRGDYVQRDLSPPATYNRPAQSDRRDNVSPDPTGVGVHSDRVSLLEPHPLPPRPDTSKRLPRNKRTPRSPGQTSRQGDGRRGVGFDTDDRRPPARRGASLLDRLQLDNTPVPNAGSSLRDRVDVFTKPDAVSFVSHHAPNVAMNDEVFDNDQEARGRAGKGKKRSGKPRRGRRGGPA